MLGGILVILLTWLLSFYMIDSLKRRYPFIDSLFLKRLFFFHLLMAFIYYLYALFNPSDSWAYYSRIVVNYRADNWWGHYGTSTAFIEFVGYPFIKFLGFSYEACMALFAFFGFVGYIYFFIFFKENVRFKHRFFNVDLITLVFFLPNLHFWSTSFGKGSIIFMGIGLFFYGISKLHTRVAAVLIGGFIIYHVRPHIMLVILASSAIGFFFTTKGISMALRVVFLICVTGVFFYIYQDVLSLVGVDEEEFVTQGLDLTHRATELRKATSGVDITSYSLPMQLFTFLYRPLFIDAPGMLGLIVSVENVFYLLLTLKVFNLRGLNFLLTSNFLVKTAFFSFITVSIALAQISGNLGLAIRQKSQVMMLFIFVIISFMEAQKMGAYRASLLQRMRHKKLMEKQKAKAYG